MRSFQRDHEASPVVEDATLLASIQRGDERAMGQMYDRYSRLVYSVSLRVLRDAAAAEEVLQEIFMQIWRNPDSVPASRGSVGGWLAVAARNRSIDQIRRRKQVTRVEEVVLASKTNLAVEAERTAMSDKARDMIRALASEQRKALEMAFYDGLTHSEIAEMTSELPATVKTRIRTALLILRRGMQA